MEILQMISSGKLLKYSWERAWAKMKLLEDFTYSIRQNVLLINFFENYSQIPTEISWDVTLSRRQAC